MTSSKPAAQQTHTLPAHREHTVDAGRGATLHVRDIGPEDAPAVLFHHGTPSCGVALPGGWHGTPPGVRLVSFDRPGYGRSGNERGRTVADAARWTQAVADQLGLEQFAVMGTSGGGPHAAAAAALLGERVTRSCIAVGIGPVGLPGFDVCAGMVPETVDEIERARVGEGALRSFVEDLLATDDPLEAWLGQLPPSDVEILGRPDVQAEEAAEASEVEAGGHEGWIEDDLALFHRDWDVDLTRTTARVVLLYGTADVLVPDSHGDAFLAAIGHGQLVKVPHAGHWMRDVEPDVLTWLVGTGPDALRLQPVHDAVRGGSRG